MSARPVGGTAVRAALGPWRVLDLMVVALPAAVVADVMGAGAPVLFVLSALAVIPLAGLVGRSTEVLAERVGGSKGALLNATFGNIAELLIAALLVVNGEIAVLKASITGSIIGNLLLLLGVSMVVAAHDKSEVPITVTSRVQATMLFLAMGILLLPTVFSFRPESSTTRLDEVSGLVALILFAVYALSMLFMLRTNRHQFQEDGEGSGGEGSGGEGSGGEGSGGEEKPSGEGEEGGRPTWSVKGAVVVLAVATALVAVAAEMVASSVEEAGSALGLHSGFIGFVILPLVGNAAEQFSALGLAAKDRLGVASEIAVGASMQLAMFVVPILVLLGLVTGHPFDLAFSPLELSALIIGTLLTRHLLDDGKANWLEGVMLLGLYLAFAGAVFFADLSG
ncbi:calcium/proton exchanger [Phycicoccus sp. M110.8]|uniref:calcium/proton exchanger n=1 Tax=Phycicoccus sp. M110.8 TaxID=3075433 RepID=UPI0028FD4989|nr:calcium/proton exchanger [Phycicoccus sp. M110.8]MDU0312259.1 calcium/proton exchanger [Phycicoccus sp. M110.8]